MWCEVREMRYQSLLHFLPTKQCEAETTHSGEISDPPHICVLFRSRATCQGHAPGELTWPPTIRLASTSLWRNRTPHSGSEKKLACSFWQLNRRVFFWTIKYDELYRLRSNGQFSNYGCLWTLARQEGITSPFIYTIKIIKIVTRFYSAKCFKW